MNIDSGYPRGQTCPHSIRLLPLHSPSLIQYIGLPFTRLKLEAGYANKKNTIMHLTVD